MNRSSRSMSTMLSLILMLPGLVKAEGIPPCNRLLNGQVLSGCSIAIVGAPTGALAAYKFAVISAHSFEESSLIHASNTRTLYDSVNSPLKIQASLTHRMVQELSDGDTTEVRVILTEEESRKLIISQEQSLIEQSIRDAERYEREAREALEFKQAYKKNKEGRKVRDGFKNDPEEAARLQRLARDAEQTAKDARVRLQAAQDGKPIKLQHVVHRFEQSRANKVHKALAMEAQRGSRVLKITTLSGRFAKQAEKLSFKGGSYAFMAGAAGVVAMGSLFYGAYQESEEYKNDSRSYRIERRSYRQGVE